MPVIPSVPMPTRPTQNAFLRSLMVLVLVVFYFFVVAIQGRPGAR